MGEVIELRGRSGRIDTKKNARLRKKILTRVPANRERKVLENMISNNAALWKERTNIRQTITVY